MPCQPGAAAAADTGDAAATCQSHCEFKRETMTRTNSQCLQWRGTALAWGRAAAAPRGVFCSPLSHVQTNNIAVTGFTGVGAGTLKLRDLKSAGLHPRSRAFTRVQSSPASMFIYFHVNVLEKVKGNVILPVPAPLYSCNCTHFLSCSSESSAPAQKPAFIFASGCHSLNVRLRVSGRRAAE